MSDEEVIEKIRVATTELGEKAQALADVTDTHIELALGMFGVLYYHYYHPASCPEGKTKQLPEHNDIPDVFKRLWEDGGAAEEPKV